MDLQGTPDMNVYLVPVKTGGHALYCEAADEPSRGAADRSTLWGRLAGWFHRALTEGDEERRGVPPAGGPPRSRVRRAVTRRLADAVAEQRLLWHLRHETSALLVHADDIPSARALELARTSLAADWHRHRRWSVIDALLAVASTPAMLLPGPNVLAYYFLIRVVGHYLSMRGARQGLQAVAWHPEPSPELTSLAAALRLDPDARVRHVDEIAKTLGLKDLQRFVDGARTRPS